MHDALRARLRALAPALRPGLRTASKRAYYFGLHYQCPFCRSRLRTMLPFGHRFPVLKDKHVVGGSYRPNAVCPVCGSFDRERLLYLYLCNKTTLFESPHRLLHVAPEARVASVLRATATIDYVTADLSGRGVMVLMDITQIQFADDHFDAIICNHVLEHIIDDGKAMAELHRTLKPGGWAILQVPLSQSLSATYEDGAITTEVAREQAFGQADHVRIYASDYGDRLARAGFEVEVFAWPTEAERFGGRGNRFALNEEEAVYCVRKRVSSSAARAAAVAP